MATPSKLPMTAAAIAPPLNPPLPGSEKDERHFFLLRVIEQGRDVIEIEVFDN